MEGAYKDPREGEQWSVNALPAGISYIANGRRSCITR